MNLIYSWTGPQVSGGDDISLDLLITNPLADPHFFPVPPTGDIPTNWGPAPRDAEQIRNHARNFDVAIFQNAMDLVPHPIDPYFKCTASASDRLALVSRGQE